MAARAGVAHQRHAFRNLSHGGYCFWAFGRRRGRYGSQTLVASENPDDAGSIPLYEQIYALAGLAQYYRITADWEVLEDIRLSVRAFNRYYRDSAEGGYFSHLDYVTMRADSDALGQNQARKNWNSVGDHLPAYLVNVILALEPLSQDDHDGLGEFLAECKEMLGHTSDLIVSKFPDPPNPYVNERFLADWTPDHHWGWQQNRAIVGHNLKIAWNLTRVANYYRWRAAQKDDDASEIDYKQKAEALTEVAAEIGLNMVEHGLDQIRSGVFDAVERDTRVGKGLNFPWANTKDFWQQEQGILAYLILHGATRDRRFLDLAREVAAFWNLFFLDHDYRGIFFRVTDNGDPVIRGDHGKKGGHAISGYHAFELNYLAHIYTRTYADGARGNFCLYFNPSKDSGVSSINVLPDFVPPGSLTVAAVTVNGRRRRDVDPDNFRIPLAESELGSELVVEFAPREVANGRP